MDEEEGTDKDRGEEVTGKVGKEADNFPCVELGILVYARMGRGSPVETSDTLVGKCIGLLVHTWTGPRVCGVERLMCQGWPRRVILWIA